MITKTRAKKLLDEAVRINDEVALTELLLLHEINDNLKKLIKVEDKPNDKSGTVSRSRKKT